MSSNLSLSATSVTYLTDEIFIRLLVGVSITLTGVVSLKQTLDRLIHRVEALERIADIQTQRIAQIQAELDRRRLLMLKASILPRGIDRHRRSQRVDTTHRSSTTSCGLAKSKSEA